MNTPSVTTLAIASIIENALAPIFATLSGPLTARIEELEKLNSPSDFIDKVRDAVLQDDDFDSAVLSVIEDHSGDVIKNLGGDLTEKIQKAQIENIGDRIFDVIHSGSFNIGFTRY